MVVGLAVLVEQSRGEAVSQLDSRAASHHSPERRMRPHDVLDADDHVHHPAVGLEEVFYPVDCSYYLLLIHNQVSDLEHSPWFHHLPSVVSPPAVPQPHAAYPLSANSAPRNFHEPASGTE
ncbi:hypothetical protein F444_03476 [Phytophthora nicotianae P1976]|uniref:Uncharacterized protein n=1 Tax=Phytophthora nicotianae P1976 TaxID=1317066 RepID=A0A081AU12_PHYNI|nr:hypothetical protein F444_03476 [Phytophthora nicotianae P1976]